MAKKATAMKPAEQPHEPQHGSTSHHRTLLHGAVAALQSGAAPVYATPEEMAPLAGRTPPLVESNANLRDTADPNKIAWRATPDGVNALSGPEFAEHSTEQQPASTAAPAAPAEQPQPTFTFDADVPIPEPRRGGRGQNVYGFEAMGVGHSFFIPADNDNENPAKRIASTVSSASKRLAPKQFVVRSVDETDKGRGKGARVWRVK